MRVNVNKQGDKQMKRREFFTLSGAVALGAAAGCTRNPQSSGGRSESMGNGLNLQSLRDQYREALFGQYLPNISEFVYDHENGGFMCTVDIRTGELLDEIKRTWFEGRGMWSYAYLYNHLEQNPEYLEIARKSKDFIMRHRPEGDRFWVHSYNRQGEPNSTEESDIYGSLFVAEGLAEYAKASGEEEYFDIAKSITLNALSRYDEPDYQHRDGVPGRRYLGHWMVFLIGTTHMLQIQDDPELKEISDRSIDAIMNSHMNSDYQLLNEYLNHDMSLPKEESQYAYLGHGTETLWMVMYEALRRGDQELLEQAAAHFKRHATVAQDAVYGGYFRSLNHVGDHDLTVDKVLWLQEEVLIGTLLMVEHLDDDWARRTFQKTHDYVMETYARPGYKFWIPNGDRTLQEYNSRRAENYHHPRHLMLNLLSIERMLNRA